MHEWAVMSLLVYLNCFYMTTWITVAEAWDSRHTIVLLSDLCTQSPCLFASVSKHHMCDTFWLVSESNLFKFTKQSISQVQLLNCSWEIYMQQNNNHCDNWVSHKTTNKAMADQICRGMQALYSHSTHNRPGVVIHDEQVISILCVRIMTNLQIHCTIIIWTASTRSPHPSRPQWP